MEHPDASTPPEETGEPRQPRQGDPKRRWIILGAAGLLVVVIVIVIVWLTAGGDDSAEADPDPGPSASASQSAEPDLDPGDGSGELPAGDPMNPADPGIAPGSLPATIGEWRYIDSDGYDDIYQRLQGYTITSALVLSAQPETEAEDRSALGATIEEVEGGFCGINEGYLEGVPAAQCFVRPGAAPDRLYSVTEMIHADLDAVKEVAAGIVAHTG